MRFTNHIKKNHNQTSNSKLQIYIEEDHACREPRERETSEFPLIPCWNSPKVYFWYNLEIQRVART